MRASRPRGSAWVRKALAVFITLTLIGATTAAASDTAPAWAKLASRRLPLLAPCSVPGVEETLLCGTLEVWENREKASGRKIGLIVVVVPATQEKPPNDPVVIFAGGPGGAATGRAAASVWAGPVRKRDILLIDQRGTGGSHALDCDFPDPSQAGELAPLYPREAVARCAAKLGETSDLLQYGSAAFADDVEEVRQRLGYGPLNIQGGSYGTRSMLVFAQRHPASTRTLFGIGVDSPLRSNLAERGLSAQAALEELGRRCAAVPACRALVPDLAASAARLLARVEKEPVAVTVPAAKAGEAATALLLRRPWLSEQLRTLLYYTKTARALPWALHRAEAGDWVPLARLTWGIERWFRSTLAEGVTLAVQCSESLGFDQAEARRRGAATIFGSDRLEQQLEGCSAWPHHSAAPLGVEKPKPLPIPTLLLSGALDAVTPPSYGEDIRTYLPRSLHVVITEAHHGPFDLEGAWPCIHRVWADFLERGTVEGLDVSCLEELPGPPLAVDGERFEGYLSEAFAP